MVGPATARFAAVVEPMLERGDPAFTSLGSGPTIAESFARLEAETHRSVWSMQPSARMSMNRLTRSLDEAIRSRGLEERVIHTARSAHSLPLLTSFEPTMRIGPVPFALIVSDERHAVVAGLDRRGDGGTAWGTDDPTIVRLARAAFLDVWEASVPWPDAGLRPPLPQRRFHVALLLVDGLSDSRIADELGIGERTVSSEVRAIVDWLGARNRSHAVAMLVGAA